MEKNDLAEFEELKSLTETMLYCWDNLEHRENLYRHLSNLLSKMERAQLADILTYLLDRINRCEAFEKLRDTKAPEGTKEWNLHEALKAFSQVLEEHGVSDVRYTSELGMVDGALKLEFTGNVRYIGSPSFCYGSVRKEE